MANVYGKIWRTVVFSGAMLGAPVIAAADAPAQKQPDAKKAAPAKPESVDKLQKDRAELDKKIAAAVDSVAAAQTDKDRAAAKAKLDALQIEKAALNERLAAAKAAAAKTPVKPEPPTPLDKLQRDLNELNMKIDSAVDSVAAAQSDADRKAAIAKLDSLRKQKAELETKIAAEKAKQADAQRKKEAEKRPRAKEDDRPIGRGFILS